MSSMSFRCLPRVVSRPLVAAALAAAAVAFPAAVSANAAPITCGDIAGLKTAIMAGGTIDLTPYCVYVLTAADSGVDGLPAVTNNTVINGNHATIQRDPALTSATPFRILRIASGGNLTVSDLTVMNGLLTGFEFGGGILVQSGGALTATSNLTIQGNRVLRQGGGLRVEGSGAAELTASLIKDNTANSISGGLGGGIDSSGNLKLHGTVVSSNRAGEYGGGIYKNGVGRLGIDQNSVITNNRATGAGADDGGGGGILAFGGGSITDSVVTNNTVTNGQGGGGIIADSGMLTVTRSIISGNTLAYNITLPTLPATGAGILADGNTSNVVLDGSTVTGNKIVGARGRGAGLAATRGTITLQNTSGVTTVSNNLASGSYSQGGGLYTASGTTLNAIGAVITGNKATGTGSQGGGIFNNGGSLSLDGATSVTSNTAATAPGGIWTSVPFATTATVTGNIPTNCAASPATVTGCTG
ncbi:hypothetical protein [Streptomyces sp. NPDC086787]|uniref:hypothetical protein n=1 Tax=Streptomyces sp. NPDC086787 TaxID=3365759 RepID=UPI00380FC061